VSDVLRETLAALDMPREGLLRWFEKNRRFCKRHGGERYYSEWLALYDECVSAIDDPPSENDAS
jgi:hypothetical protein